MNSAPPINRHHLRRLEDESIHIFREVAAEAEKPVMLYSVGKDSACMLHVAKKAFRPGKLPFPLLHVDTTWKFPEMYEYRDRMAREAGAELIVWKNESALDQIGRSVDNWSCTQCAQLLKTTALVSDEAKSQSTLDVFRPMGRIVLSGRSTPVMVWEPKPSVPEEMRRKLVELWERFDEGDLSALAELEQVSAANKGDAALANFVYRIREAGPGGHFVLGSK